MRDKLFRAAAVAIVKNEAAYIAEWIEYHTLIGIEHFFVFDNNSDDNLSYVLKPYLVQGRATLLNWPGYPEQMSAYNYAIHMFGHACCWMTLIDIDEFIRVPGRATLPDHLDSLGDYDQVLMPWIIFGAGGHHSKPDSLVIESYLRRLAEASRPVKCVVRPGAGFLLDAIEPFAVVTLAELADDMGGVSAEPGVFGRPFCVLAAETDIPTNLVIRLLGHDAAGYPYHRQIQISLQAGTSIGSFILSPRTISFEKIEWTLPTHDTHARIKIGAYSFT